MTAWAERGEVYRQQCEWRMTAWAERGEVYRQQRERVSEVFSLRFICPISPLQEFLQYLKLQHPLQTLEWSPIKVLAVAQVA